MNIPFEVAGEILIHLPIDPFLCSVALASKSKLMPLLYLSLAFSRRHLKHQLLLASKNDETIWEYLDRNEIQHADWLVLPFTFKTALYEALIAADPADVEFNVNDEFEAEIEFIVDKDGDNEPFDHESHPLRWPLTSTQALSITKILLDSSPTFKPDLQSSRALRWAARNGHTDVARLLLSDPLCDPSAEDNEAIQLACGFGYTDLVRFLLQDPRVDLATEENKCLIWASFKGNTEIVRILLQDSRVDPTKQEDAAFIAACATGQVDIIRLFLSDGRCDPTSGDHAALECAAQMGHVDVLELLLADPRVAPKSDYAFNRAVEEHHYEAARLLLKDGRVCSEMKKRELFIAAAQAGDVDMVESMLMDQQVIDAIAEEDKTTEELENRAIKALREATTGNDVDVNLTESSNPLKFPSKTIRDAIQEAAEHGHHKVVDVLFGDCRVEVDSILVESIMESGNLEVFERFIQHPRVAVIEIDFNALLEKAAGMGKLKLLQSLLSSSRVNSLDGAFHNAVTNGHLECVEVLLLDSRIGPSVNDNAAITAAAVNGHVEIVQLLSLDPRVDPSMALPVGEQSDYEVCLGTK
ncbi:UNVERIFIED_CONTAM: hypothetical protein HDU68_005533 [Siphonaria sp. JEL0065]|nr:hypothetical protein HDU68_005533 [Siphonaria sp. JEL0065]